MLLGNFQSELDLQRELGRIDPDRSGREMAQSLVIEVRVVLASHDPSSVNLPNVGELIRSGKNVRFDPSEVLKADLLKQELKLERFLKEKLGIPLLRDVEEFKDLRRFQNLPDPYLGLPMLEECGAELLRHFARTDPRLEKVPWGAVLEALCFVIHDAICCGAGIELETVGTFQGLTFDPDDILKSTIEHMRTSNTSNSSDVKVSLLMIDDSLSKSLSKQ